MSTRTQDGWLVGTTSEELRATYLAWRFEPIARLVFRAMPEVESVTVGFAQYWCDEAQDAVHAELALSPQRDPSWLTDERSFPSERSDQREQVLRTLLTENGLPSEDDDNATLIVAFASCCREMSSQDSEHIDYTPWAIARRGGDRPEVEVVGRVHRPEWEDRWDACVYGNWPTLALDASVACRPGVRDAILTMEPDPVAWLRSVVRRIQRARWSEPDQALRLSARSLESLERTASRVATLREHLEAMR